MVKEVKRSLYKNGKFYMRVCLIGYGYWVKIWIRVFSKDLVGICDYDEDNLDKVKKTL